MNRRARQARAFAADERAQSLVEIALAVPLLLLIVLGLVDVGRIYTVRVGTADAAREAALLAARDPQATLDSVCQRARDSLGAGPAAAPCSATPVVVTCTRAVSAGAVTCGNDTTTRALLFQTPGAAGADATVTVSYELNLLTTYLVGRAFAVNPVHVTSTAVFKGLRE